MKAQPHNVHPLHPSHQSAPQLTSILHLHLPASTPPHQRHAVTHHITHIHPQIDASCQDDPLRRLRMTLASYIFQQTVPPTFLALKTAPSTQPAHPTRSRLVPLTSQPLRPFPSPLTSPSRRTVSPSPPLHSRPLKVPPSPPHQSRPSNSPSPLMADVRWMAHGRFLMACSSSDSDTCASDSAPGRS